MPESQKSSPSSARSALPTDCQSPSNQDAKADHPIRIVVLISGSGRSLENLALRCADGRLSAKITHVISSNDKAFGLERCRRLGLPFTILPRSGFASDKAFSDAVFAVVRAHQADLVVLAGFLKFLPVPDDFARRVINIHPSLLPKFGGRGMYGHHVHEAVLKAGERESGCTVHIVDQEYDHGPVIVQKRCAVVKGDTADILADRVFALELEALPEAIEVMRQGILKRRERH